MGTFKFLLCCLSTCRADKLAVKMNYNVLSSMLLSMEENIRRLVVLIIMNEMGMDYGVFHGKNGGCVLLELLRAIKRCCRTSTKNVEFG